MHLKYNLWNDDQLLKQDITRRQRRHDQKLIRLGEAHNELAYKIWDQSDQRYVYKCTKTA